MRRIVTTFALLGALAAAPALAQGDLTADVSLAREDRQVRSVFLADLKAVVAQAGHTISAVGENGTNSVRAATPEGMIFQVNGAVCDTEIRPGCLGININVRYNGDNRVTLQKINGANLMWPAVSVAVEGAVGGTGSTVVITRYVILDGGMSMRNVSDNLTNALSIAGSVADYVWEVGKYAPGAAGDDAADSGDYDESGWEDEEYWDEEW